MKIGLLKKNRDEINAGTAKVMLMLSKRDNSKYGDCSLSCISKIGVLAYFFNSTSATSM